MKPRLHGTNPGHSSILDDWAYQLSLTWRQSTLGMDRQGKSARVESLRQVRVALAWEAGEGGFLNCYGLRVQVPRPLPS